MKAGYKNKEKIAGEVRVLNVRPDTPDIRDRYYQPALVQLRSQVENIGGKVLNQGTEGACTGFALAAVVNLLNMKRGQSFKASPRMFYEMAQKHDEWPGESYEGSSCRGAIRGWNNMGVCSDDEWTFVQKKTWQPFCGTSPVRAKKSFRCLLSTASRCGGLPCCVK